MSKLNATTVGMVLGGSTTFASLPNSQLTLGPSVGGFPTTADSQIFNQGLPQNILGNGNSIPFDTRGLYKIGTPVGVFKDANSLGEGLGKTLIFIFERLQIFLNP